MLRSREEEGFVVIGGNKITDTARNAEVQSERYRSRGKRPGDSADVLARTDRVINQGREIFSE